MDADVFDKIVAYCPECQTRYQLNPELRGRRMRCTNLQCRHIFVIEVPGPAPPPEIGLADEVARAPKVADAGGRLLPIIPPPRIPVGIPVPSPRPTLREPVIPVAGPAQAPVAEELFDWRTEPPPVQQPTAAPSPAVNGPVQPVEVPQRTESAPVPPRTIPRFMLPPPKPQSTVGRKVLIAGLAVFILATAGWGAWYVYGVVTQTEEKLRADAEKAYAEGRFRQASESYQKLVERFPNSSRSAEDRFMASICTVRWHAAVVPPDPAEAMKQIAPFLEEYGSSPVFKPRQVELFATLLKVLDDLMVAALERLESPGELPAAEQLAEFAKQALAWVDEFRPPDGDIGPARGKYDRLVTTIARAKQRLEIKRQIVQLLTRPRPDLDAAKDLIRRFQFGEDAEIAAALKTAEAALRNLVGYMKVNRPTQPLPPEGPPSLLPDPGGTASASGPIVFAVARGILFALNERTGRPLWQARVGIDSGTLPLRMLAVEDEPETVIAVSSDPTGVTARVAATGGVRWHQPLDSPVLGRPVLVGRRLFVPTADARGRVFDIDARTGTLLGFFEVNQPLGGGVVHERGTSRLYVPAAGQQVYVLNYAPSDQTPRCEATIATGHAPGSLRGPPVLVGGEDGPRTLVLAEADGLNAMKLRAFLLIDPKFAVPPPVAEVALAGWSWFDPFHDAERIAVATDAGVLGLFGFRQPGMLDAPLFPLLDREPRVADPAAPPAKAQLVHAEEQGFWVLAGERLQHWRLELDRLAGRRLTAGWSLAVKLGAPLHEPQISQDRTTLFVVTQTTSPPACLATAVHAADGRVLWQRSLGLSCDRPPLVFDNQVIALDARGALFQFDANVIPKDAPGPWVMGGKEIAPPLTDLTGPAFLLREPEGNSAYSIQTQNKSLILRAVRGGAEVSERQMGLPAALAGTPGLGPDAVILPLANGLLCRVSLDTTADRPELGPTWRSLASAPDALGHVVHWHGDQFLVTDGSRKVRPLAWPAMPEESALELERRIVGAPVVVSADPPQACVADAGGTVTLFQGTSLNVVRTWKPGGADQPITAGPFAVNGKIGCVVGAKRLVWLDPTKDEPLWTFTTPGDGLIGGPQPLVDRLVVADQSGRFFLLDVGTGKPILPAGYQHPAAVSLTTVPVPFGHGRLFAPMSDGTVLLLPVAWLTGEGH